MKRTNLPMLLAFVAGITFFGCNNDEPTPVGETFLFTPDMVNLQDTVQSALIVMNDYDVIQFSEGTFEFNATLSVDDKKNITLIGAGKDKTILDFSNQTQGGSGAQGIIATATDQILFKDFTIQDADGDNIKVKDSNGVSFVSLNAIYTGPVSPENGAYSLYPVTSLNVLVTGCYVRGASDAGIYVGQSQNVIVSNNVVEENVAGIEIENCIASDVFGNDVQNNTGGLLIFDLPGLPVIENGRQTRVFNNIIKNNNHNNFAPQGNMVGIVPPGTGLMMLACRDVEVFDNDIAGNNLMPISMFSYDILQEPDLPETFNTNVESIFIHDNTVTPVTEAYNTNQTELGMALINAYETQKPELLDAMPDIIWGGFFDSSLGVLNNNICIQSNGNASFVNLKASQNFLGLHTDPSAHDCTREPLPAVTVNARK